MPNIVNLRFGLLNIESASFENSSCGLPNIEYSGLEIQDLEIRDLECQILKIQN